MKHLVKLFVLLMAVTLVGACSNSGGEGGDKAKEADAKKNTAADFAKAMCDVSISGDIDKTLEMLHPAMLEDNSKSTGMTLEEMKEMLVENTKDNPFEKCEVVSAEEVECTEDKTQKATGLELKVDKCAEVLLKMKTAKMEEEMEETRTILEIEGKWYVGI